MSSEYAFWTRAAERSLALFGARGVLKRAGECRDSRTIWDDVAEEVEERRRGRRRKRMVSGGVTAS